MQIHNGDLTTCLGWTNPDELTVTLTTIMNNVIQSNPMELKEGILKHEEGIDLIPANIDLEAIEVNLVNVMSREYTLRTYINKIKCNYDYVLIDCRPSLGMLTINAFACSDSVIIPVQAHYLSARGMTQLVQTINKVKMQINESLKIDGVLLTLADTRTKMSKTIEETIKENYGSKIKIYNTVIPVGIKAVEGSAAGKSVYAYDKNSKPAKAYEEFSKEVLKDVEKQRYQSKTSECR